MLEVVQKLPQTILQTASGNVKVLEANRKVPEANRKVPEANRKMPEANRKVPEVRCLIVKRLTWAIQSACLPVLRVSICPSVQTVRNAVIGPVL
jgi:hypothetical protein